MAKITIAGSAVVITSELKLEDVKTVKKYRPEALTLMGGKNKDEAIFKIGVTECGPGEIGKYGACFDAVSYGDSGLATVTMCRGEINDDTDIKELIADRFGSAVSKLNELEQTLPAVIEEIAAQKAAVIDSITVA